MIDIRVIREQPDLVKTACRTKNAAVSDKDVDHLLKLDGERRELLAKTEQLSHERKVLAAESQGGKPSEAQMARGKSLREELAAAEAKLAQLDADILVIWKQIPNLPAADVPVGKTEADNVVAKTWGEPTKFDFEPKNHWQLAEPHGWIDKERAAKVAGARFAYLKGNLVRLHFAMIQFGMDVLTSETVLAEIAERAGLAGKVSTRPFTLVMPPAVVRTEVYEATGRLNAQEVTYKLEDDDLWLNASAEHSMAPMYQNEIVEEAELPLRFAGYATSFRREAGTYGKDTEGIFRLHQFDKLELESFTVAEASLDEHLFMVAIQEYLMQQLEIPYQVLMKCTADIGKPNARGVDLEAWLPAQGKYRETHTADLITDYQTRRLQTRVRRTSGQVELAHTNDATAFSQRPLIAIIENYQQADGTIRVPAVLQKYYGGEIL
ncbi:MAG TPA: serine--tRNA ligase [Candidatus Saccharimonadia bacterium]|nr:serine--tRNA ligase [Candidatus Saccharimonadia bacterium]